MLNKFYQWTKSNKVATLIIFALVLGLLYKQNPIYKAQSNLMYTIGMGNGGRMESGIVTDQVGNDLKIREMPIPTSPAPIMTPDRKVISNAYISLQVESVNKSVEQVKEQVAKFTGYIVNINIDRPEFGESATVSVRIPADKVEEFLNEARANAVKIVSENLSGNDVTDQYVDTQTRLAQLEEQKTMLQNILKSAKTVDEIMKVQPYITSVQEQIDALKGQTKYIDAASQTTLITLYLSTDELSLPYTPDTSWRPQVVFKNAVRSLLTTLQKAGSGLIWVGVYSILIVPAISVVAIIYLIARRKQRQ